MRFFMVLGAVIALILTGLAPVEAASREAEIVKVINRQVEAFQRDDAATAFEIASPTIQKMFGDAARFLGMVALGYPQIHRAKSLDFRELIEVDGQLLQKVVVEGQNGTVLALYEMVEIDGAWRIDGCSIVEPPGEKI